MDSACCGTVPTINFWMVVVKRMALEEREDQKQEVTKCQLFASQMAGAEPKLQGLLLI